MTTTGAVQTWLISGEEVPRASVADLFDVLDAEERRRADCLTLAEGRRRFIVAHGATRFIVAEHLGAPPDEIAWKTGRHGKPELTGRWTGVHVNLSHSGSLCLVALSEFRPVGADVQQISSTLDVIAMARRYFSPEEARTVAEGRDADDRARTFARLWARKEAAIKADGGRLAQALPCPALGEDGAVVEIPASGRRGDADFPAHVVFRPATRAGVAAAGGVTGGVAAGDVAASAQLWAAGIDGCAAVGDDGVDREISASAPYRVVDVPAPPGFRAAIALAGIDPFTVESRSWTP